MEFPDLGSQILLGGRMRNTSNPPPGPTIATAGSIDVATFEIGVTQTITPGTATASGGGTVTYELRHLADVTVASTIASYAHVPSDDGLTGAAQWRAVETGGTNPGETNWQTVGFGTISYAPPVNTGLPTISGGTSPGDVLSTTLGTWSASGETYSFQWRRDGAPIGGATASSYTIVVADDGSTIDCQVTATNSGGSATATSNSILATQFDVSSTATGEILISGNQPVSVTIIEPAYLAGTYTQDVNGVSLASVDFAAGPACLVSPLIKRVNDADATGTTTEGDSVGTDIPEDATSHGGVWIYDTGNGSLSISRMWQSDTGGNGVFADIVGATASTYTLSASETGDDLRIVETATDGGGSRSADSNVLSVVSGTLWDVEDDFAAHSSGQVLNATALYDQVFRNNAGAQLVVSTTPTRQIHSDGWTFPYEVVAHTGRTWTNNQRAEVDVVPGPGADDYTVAAGVRLDGGTNRGYTAEWWSGDPTSIQIRKITGIGSQADIGAAILITAPTLPFSLAIEATTNGADADLEVFLDGVSQGSRTDSSGAYLSGDAGFGQYMNADDSAAAGDAAGAIATFKARDA